MLESLPAIERWFRLEWMEHTPPFYASVDLRNAGFKLAPVDTDLHPGGFNNLTPQMLPLAVQAAMAAIEKICPEAKNLLLIPEADARSTFYLMNLRRLVQIFHQAGLNVRLGRLTRDQGSAADPADGSTDHRALAAHARGRLNEGLRPRTVLLNNDLSAGIQSAKTCTSSTCCRRCTQAGRCAGRPTTFRATKRWRRNLPSCWAWTRG
jgi:glutamate--cysteine ligase